MFTKRLSVGNLDVNCYIVADEETKEAVVIDPGAEANRILEIIDDNDFQVKYVINTHGHSDHIAANSDIIEATKAELLIHEEDAEFLQNSELNLSSFIGLIGQELDCPPADRLLKDGEEIEVGKLTFEVIHTPGHTPGGISLRVDDILFSGDTLFAMGVGRVDLPRSSHQALRDSINKILAIKEDLKLYPGHGPSSTLEQTKKQNSYI
ncbi:MBL fold metallo-hydrolase [Natroniella sulfidigena]|uniref:MBL fold metallo-hydrolase n=1 Tax=Natroniella sulfidigena TaxID=723921 RepID=UPI00200A9B23|nr:MBL fold metallo-hydrolase [Natroniella sulfidigena]MCK8815978.1 MBL fold metallo-hydrolase [Natroniella sulfidigena]